MADKIITLPRLKTFKKKLDKALGDYAKKVAAVGSIDLSIDSSTYIITLQAKDINGTNLGPAKTIDLPLESIVVSASYYEEYTYEETTYHKVIVMVLSTTDVPTIIPVADLVDGLQAEITNDNKLDADLVDDTNATNKFATQAQLDQIATNTQSITAIKDGTSIDSFGDVESALADKVDKVAGKGLSTEDYTTAEKTKLANISAEANKVEASETNGNIKIDGVETTVYTPDAQVQSDWTEDDSSKASYILNKPTLAPVATSGDYADLSNTPTNISAFTNDANYITKDEAIYIVDYSNPDFAEVTAAFNAGKVVLLTGAAPDASSYALLNYVTNSYATFSKFLTSRHSTYAAFNSYYLTPQNTWSTGETSTGGRNVILRTVEPNQALAQGASSLSTLTIGGVGYAVMSVEVVNSLPLDGGDADKLYLIKNGAAPETLDTLMNTAWEFNSALDLSGTIQENKSYKINFTDADSTAYTELSKRGSQRLKYKGSDPDVYNGAWADEAYKTVSITGGNDVADAELMAFFEKNATLLSSEQIYSYDSYIYKDGGRKLAPDFKITVNGIEYPATDGKITIPAKQVSGIGIDAVPTENSQNLVRSGGVYSAIQGVSPVIVQDLTDSVAFTISAQDGTDLKTNHYIVKNNTPISGLINTYEFVNIKFTINGSAEYAKLSRNKATQYIGMLNIEENNSLYELVLTYKDNTIIVFRCAQVY